MSSVLLISAHGDGVPIALKLAQEGTVVKVYLKAAQAKDSLKGYRNPVVIPSVAMPEQYDLILFDMAGLGKTADALKSQGRLVLGGGALNDNLELNRDYGEKVASKLTSLKVPRTERFETPAKLLDFLEKSSKAVVVKPLGNAETVFTLVSSDPTNRTLSGLVQSYGDKLCPCITQEKIDGVEVSTEGWFAQGKWQALNHTIEHKRFLEGDIGPQTGCMGNIVWACEEDELVKQALIPLTQFLTKAEYCGPLDINCIVTEEDAYFLEFTPRFGYDAFQALTELYKGSTFEFLWKAACGSGDITLSEDYAIAVRLSFPPYPSGSTKDFDNLKGVQVLDVNSGAETHTFLSDVQLRDELPVLAGIDGVIGCVTARGSSIQEARRRAYRTVGNIVIDQSVQYRRDIGLGTERKIETLKTWGWL